MTKEEQKERRRVQAKLDREENNRIKAIYKKSAKEFWKKHAKDIVTHNIYSTPTTNDELAKILRKQVHTLVKGIVEERKANNLLGCSRQEYKAYLESKFTSGMSWDNYGQYGWHIDHIRPCVSFDLTKSSDILECFNYKNTQPMWAKDNLSKGKKYAI